VEIPAAVKPISDSTTAALGSLFEWPGHDLRRIGRGDRHDYGFLPLRFFDRVLDAFTAWYRANKAHLISRD
jgi:hypothetical protein